VKVYVAGHLTDSASVADAQRAVLAAGHEVTHDWSQDLEFTTDYASRPEQSRQIAEADLRGVMLADAVIVIASSPEPGRGLFVELGAALARAEMGLLRHVVAVGTIVHESVFYYHPRVRRVETVQEWLAEIGSTASD
jgi:nucleoside 2-deoxyribosyltransferase